MRGVNVDVGDCAIASGKKASPPHTRSASIAVKVVGALALKESKWKSKERKVTLTSRIGAEERDDISSDRTRLY